MDVDGSDHVRQVEADDSPEVVAKGKVSHSGARGRSRRNYLCGIQGESEGQVAGNGWLRRVAGKCCEKKCEDAMAHGPSSFLLSSPMIGCKAGVFKPFA